MVFNIMRISSVMVILTMLFNNVPLYAGGGQEGKKDSNGLRQADYDKNGWALKDGKWVKNPKGEVVYKAHEADYIDDTVNENINIEYIGEYDINGLKPEDYDVNGWGFKDGNWVASPSGAVYIYADEIIEQENDDKEKPKMSTTKKVLIGIGAVALAAAAFYAGYKGYQYIKTNNAVNSIPQKTSAPTPSSQPINNKIEGLRRENQVASQLSKQYPENKGYTVLSEVYLRDKNGTIVKDPVTNEGRRVDFMVAQNGKVLNSIEVTSQTASKDMQLAKEMRIREIGGNFVRDNEGNLIQLPTKLETKVERLE
jgi:cell division protein FtsL